MQPIRTDTIGFVGYTPDNELLVVRESAGVQSVQSNTDAKVYVGTVDEPLENICERTENRTIPPTEQHGLVGACRQKAYVLDGPMELLERRFTLGTERCFMLDGMRLFPLPPTHFSFYEDQQKLYIYRALQVIKFGGCLKQNNAAHTRIILTGIRGPIEEWIQSAEIFASPLGQTETPRVRVTNVITPPATTSPTSYTLETVYGNLVIKTRKPLFARASSLNCTWNGTPIDEFNMDERLWIIRSADGVIL